MLRSLFAGVSGLRNHQVRMDVIGNNIANVNTVGFKASRVNFAEALSQTIQGAQAPSEARGGMNAMQVGLGVQVGSIDTLFTQGNLQYTGNLTDLAIQGDGFLVVGDGLRRFYTRDGAVVMDAEGNLVHASSGLRLMGWPADATGAVDTAGPLAPLTIPVGTQIPPRATALAALTGNLDAGAPVYDPDDPTTASGRWTTTLTVYDALGNPTQLRLVFTKQGANEWQWELYYGEEDSPVESGTLSFADPDNPGRLSDPTGPVEVTVPLSSLAPDLGAPDLTFEISFGAITQYASPSTVALQSQDGYASGSLESFAIDGNGVITGLYSNGRTQVIGQVALALFTNPGGLLKVGSNLYAESSNSGPAAVGAAGTGGRGTLTAGALEMSNVDLAQEFTNMITAQRGFQANARVITTSDELLQELLSLRR
ncbi:MAG: flagellar hook protein FlgE [Armatimonadota bacterium]|nr:flagellar hook protein FlgE [Armatimonadota bacterium]MDW8155951.1 flagellar hook protein FlgE [Armatimonadota bacterium]